MKFPGSKLLHVWDLSAHRLSLDELLKSCQQVGLTGFAEVKLPRSVGMIFYYLGVEVNVMYREGAVAHHGPGALERLRTRVAEGDGTISVFELPTDLAHLLRGLTNRHKLHETLRTGADLSECLRRLEKSEHTGTLEVQCAAATAMVLLVRGRVSNVYFETAAGLTFEKGEARRELERALDGREAQLYLADFSRDTWKSRHAEHAPRRSRLERQPAEVLAAPDQMAAEESASRVQLLDDIQGAVPALVQAFLFDLMTGAVLERRGRGAAAVKVGVLAERVPAMTQYLCDLVAAEGGDQMEQVEISTERLTVLVAVVGETQEAVALFADKAQPTALVSAALGRAVRAYAARAQVWRVPAAIA